MTRVEPLSVLDAALLGMETAGTLFHLGGACILKVPAGAPPDYVRQLYDRWRRHPVNRAPFNYRLSSSLLGRIRPTWDIVDDVDPGQHLFHIRLPHPATDESLRELLGQLHSVQLNRTRPLWEIYLIEGLAGGRFAMYTKIHHALVDGATGMRLFTGRFSRDPRKTNTPPVFTAPGSQRGEGRGNKPTDGSRLALPKLLEAVGDGPSALRGLYDRIRRLASSALDMRQFEPPSIRAPDTIFNRPITARRSMGVVSFDFAHVHRLSKIAGCTINDIVLTVCGGALRRYLRQLDELPEESLVCVVPVALTKAGNEGGGNTVSGIPVALGTDVAGVGARFEAVRASAARSKGFVHALDPALAMMFGVMLVGPMLVEALTGRRPLARPMFNVIVTNVPGPRDTLYLDGARMVELVPFALIIRGVALNVTVVSMQDRLFLAFTACPDVAPQIQRLGPLLAKGMAELEAQISRKAVSKSARRGNRRRSSAQISRQPPSTVTNAPVI